MTTEDNMDYKAKYEEALERAAAYCAKYEEALERAKAVIDISANQGETQAAIETIFPELAESEDEKIRKELLDCLRNLIIKPHEKKLRFMAWLEGLNLADLNLMKKFNKGMQEALMWGREGYEVSPDGKVKSLTQDEIDSILKKQKEQKPVEWSEEDELMRTAILNTLDRVGDYGTIGMQKDWLKSLRAKPKWKPSKDLEEAAEEYIAPIENDAGLEFINFSGKDIKDAFIAGAEWQAKQMPIDKEKLARNAASEWCHCFKCDGLINDTRMICDKPNVTCLKWRDAYRAAKIALGKVKLAQNTKVKIVKEE